MRDATSHPTKALFQVLGILLLQGICCKTFSDTFWVDHTDKDGQETVFIAQCAQQT